MITANNVFKWHTADDVEERDRISTWTSMLMPGVKGALAATDFYTSLSIQRLILAHLGVMMIPKGDLCVGTRGNVGLRQNGM